MQNTNQKSVVKMARTLDTNELAQRQQEARQKLLEGVYNGYQWVYPCAEKQSFRSFQEALEYTQEMSKAGRDLYPHELPEQTAFYYAASFWRTPEEIATLLEASDAQVAADYKTEIAEHNQLQILTLQDQLVAAELAKEEKKEQERLAAIKAKALKTATDHIASQLKEGK